jgi:HEAT repeat protein
MVSALGGAGSPGAAAGACLVLAELGGADRSRLVAEALQRGRVPAHVGLRALGMLGDPSALPSALELLEAPSGLVRKAAFEAAAALLDPARPDGRAVDPIVTQLSRPRVALEDRVALARLLGRTGSPRAAPMLGALAGVKEPELRLEAIAALGQLASGGQDQVLLEALDDEDVRVRLAAATSLGRVAGSSAALALLRRLTAASEQDRGAVGIALSGAMARTTDAPAVAMVARLLPAVGEASRDVLIEGLGRMPSPRAAELLASLAERSVSADDRRKVAEAAAGHPEMASLARRLAVDPDPSVQANAVWSLGEVGDATDRPLLDGMLAHRDVAVAGNAAGALGRLLRRGLPTDPAALCKALDDPRTYVRANVLGALTVAARRCGDGERERQLLVFDPSPVVRSGAARLVRAVAAADAAADARALRRCRFDDRVGAVAAGCRERRAAEAPAPARDRVDPTLVFVVPDGRTAPAPRAPFALVRADGLMRLGIADRRGALFELRAPRGKVSLAVPATLVR